MLALAALLVGSGAAAQGIPATDIVAVDEFIDAPRALFGRTRAGVERTLGAPSRLRARTLPGGRRAAHRGSGRAAYPGVVIGVSRGSAALRRVVITEASWALPRGLCRVLGWTARAWRSSAPPRWSSRAR